MLCFTLLALLCLCFVFALFCCALLFFATSNAKGNAKGIAKGNARDNAKDNARAKAVTCYGVLLSSFCDALAC